MGKPRVVVVGGGGAGCAVAHDRKLTAVADVTLVDNKDYFEVSWASLRPLVDPSFAERINWLHEAHLKGRAKLVVGSLALVEDKSVTLVDGTVLPYEYLVIATGAGGGIGKAMQATLPERRAYLAAEAARLAAAPSVTIVGGGPSGAELAGEILSEYPKKRVTVVHPGGALLAGAAAGNTLTPALGDAVTRRLAKMGATLVLNDRVARNGDRSFGATTEKGKDVGSAVVYDATGSRPLTAWANAPGSLAALKLDGAGRVVVTRELTLPGCGSVFALGDAAATGDQPMGYFAGLQAQLVVANLLASVASKPLKALKASPSDMMLVALGRSDGVLHAPGGFLFQGCLPACVKSGGLFVGKVRGEHGV